MVEVFTDPDLSLDRVLSFSDSREIFKQFMSQEKSLGRCTWLWLLINL